MLCSALFYVARSSSAQEVFEWVPVNDGLEGDMVPVLWKSPAGHFYAGGIGGLFRSEGYMQPWEATDLVGFDVGVIRAHPEGYLLAGTREGLLESFDDGHSWMATPMEYAVFDIAVTQRGDILLATSFGILRQLNGEDTWSVFGQWTRENGTDIIGITSVAITDNGRIWASVLNSIYYIDEGEEWQCISSGGQCIDYGLFTRNVEAIGDNLLFSTFSGTFLYEKEYEHVVSVNLSSEVAYYASSDSAIYGVTLPKQSSSGSFPNALFRSSDQGKNWSYISGENLVARSVVVSDDDNLICVGQATGVRCSEDNGSTWNTWNDGLANVKVAALFSASDGALLAGAIPYSVYKLTSLSSQWERSQLEGSFDSVGEFWQSSSGVIIAGSNWLYRTSDSGITWEAAEINKVTAQKNSIGLSISESSDIPSVEVPYSFPCPYKGIDYSPFISWNDTSAFVIKDELRWSSDLWDTFVSNKSISQYGDRKGLNAISLTATESILVGGQAGVLLRSEDRGNNWTRTVINGDVSFDFLRFAVLPSGKILAATTAGIYRSIDQGSSWNRVTKEKCFNTIALSNQGLILADGNYLSRDEGETWEELPQPPAQVISSTFNPDGTPFIGTYGKGVFKGSVPIPVSTVKLLHDTDLSFHVYPNPVKGQTITTQLTLNSAQEVEIVIHDLLGRKVQVVLNEFMQNGMHRRQLSFTKIPPGLYIVVAYVGVKRIPVLLTVVG